MDILHSVKAARKWMALGLAFMDSHFSLFFFFTFEALSECFFIFCAFRFWKQGYWRSHLQGRRYHISALYVVDLKRFRRIAAGDRLRGQYQALSQDPNSLSNLDQVCAYFVR